MMAGKSVGFYLSTATVTSTAPGVSLYVYDLSWVGSKQVILG